MKYWKEKESNPTDEMKFWTGTHITKLEENEIFVYRSNPMFNLRLNIHNNSQII